MANLSGGNIIDVNILNIIEGGQITIEGDAPPSRVLATDLLGTLIWSENDFAESSISNADNTATVVCVAGQPWVVITGVPWFQSGGPGNSWRIDGNMANGNQVLATMEGITGWYDANFESNSIVNTGTSPSGSMSSVTCLDNGLVELDGRLSLPSQVIEVGGFKGTANQVIVSDGVNMSWTKSPLPINSDNLDINSLIVEGFVPGIASYGVIIKTGLRVDGLASFKGLLGVVVDELLLVQKNIDCRGSIQLHNNLYMTATSNISINGDVGLEKQVLGKDDDNNLKWITLPPPSSHGLIAGLNIDQSYLDYGTIATLPDVEFYSVKVDGGGLDILDKIKINGVAGTKDQIIVANTDGTIRWDKVENIYTPPSPDPDTTIVKFKDVEVRAGRWQRILDCRLSKGGKTSTNQVFINSIDMRPYTPGNSNPFAYWYFRDPRNIDEVVHFDFKYLKDNIFIPYPAGSAYIYPVSCGFVYDKSYTIIGNVILHSTVSTDLYFQLPAAATKVFRGFNLFYQNTTGWIAGGVLPNHSALPCNLDCDLKLFYEEGSNIVTINLECWTDVTLGTEAQYTLGNNTAMTTSGIINNLY